MVQVSSRRFCFRPAALAAASMPWPLTAGMQTLSMAWMIWAPSPLVGRAGAGGASAAGGAAGAVGAGAAAGGGVWACAALARPATRIRLARRWRIKVPPTEFEAAIRRKLRLGGKRGDVGR